MRDRIHKNRHYRNTPFELQEYRKANFLDFDAPKPSAQEVELQQKTLDALNRAEREGLAIEPFMLQTLGLKKIPTALSQQDSEALWALEKKRDEALAAGKSNKEIQDIHDAIAGYTEKAKDFTYEQLTEEERIAGMSTLEQKQYDVTSLELDRQMKALKGELPVSEGTVQRRAEETKQFESEMSRRLGPNWKTSTPGIQAQKEFESRWGIMEESERMGQMQRGTGAIIGQTGLLQGTQSQKTGQYAGLPQRNLGLMDMYGKAQQPYQYQRGLEAESKAGLMQDIGKLGGMGIYGIGKKQGYFG